jgi:hypothetical protein
MPTSKKIDASGDRTMFQYMPHVELYFERRIETVGAISKICEADKKNYSQVKFSLLFYICDIK